MDQRSPGSPGIFSEKPHLLKATMLALFILAMMVRIYFMNGPGTVPDRQYRSALIARAYYLNSLPSVPEWRKNVAATSSHRQEILEPRITEWIVAVIYRGVKGEHLWIARLVTSLLWLLGALFLFLVAKRIGSLESAVVSTAYFLFVPFGILISLSFLPEPLMITMMLLSILSILRYYDSPSTRRLFIAALVSGLAILIKPFVVFTILGAFTLLAIYRKGSLKRFIDAPFLTFAVVSLLPSVLFYGYGIFLADYLRWKMSTSLLPHLFLSSEFWKGWIQAGSDAVGLTALVLALLGFPALKRGLPRILLVGLWAGYLTFCLFFNYYIHYEPYYHAQLIVIVALSIGPVVTLLARYLRQLYTRGYEWAFAVSALLLLVFTCFQGTKQQQVYPNIEGENVALEIGDIVNHSDRVAYVAPVYGLPLEYYGELAGEYWPRRTKSWPLRRSWDRPLSIDERIATLGFSPEYFVITSFDEYRRHHSDLKEFLEQNCDLVAQSDHYLIYKIPTLD